MKLPTILLVATIAALITSSLVPLVIRVAHLLKAIDRPGGRKAHAGDVPRLGGLAIGCGALFGLGAAAFVQWHEWDSPLGLRDSAVLVLGTAMVFLVGLVDDILGLSALKKLLVQIAAAILVVASGWQFEAVGLPGGLNLELGAWSGLLTVLWIVGVTNAINLIDGLDGLATGVVAIIASSLLIFAFLLQSSFMVLVMAGTLGACLGFLPHNWDPAKIFMGDSGAQPLGFLLATLSVYSSLKSPATVAILVPILALGVPVTDTLLVMFVRFMERPKGKLVSRVLRVFKADRNHLHHLLETLPISRPQIVRWIYAMVAVSCAMAITVALTKQGGLGWLLIAVELAAVYLVRHFRLAQRARQIALQRRQELKEDLPWIGSRKVRPAAGQAAPADSAVIQAPPIE